MFLKLICLLTMTGVTFMSFLSVQEQIFKSYVNLDDYVVKSGPRWSVGALSLIPQNRY